MKAKHNTLTNYLHARRFILFVFMILGMNVYSQNQSGLWTDKTETQTMKSSNRPIIPLHYRTVSVNLTALKNILSKAPVQGTNTSPKSSHVIVSLPLPDGTIQRFSIVESPVMAPELAAKYPEIKT